jgi:hypothetical protein
VVFSENVTLRKADEEEVRNVGRLLAAQKVIKAPHTPPLRAPVPANPDNKGQACSSNTVQHPSTSTTTIAFPDRIGQIDVASPRGESEGHNRCRTAIRTSSLPKPIIWKSM